MKIFEDKEMTKETSTLNFGVVLAGESKKITYYLYNDTDAEVEDLKPRVDNKEVSVVSFKEKMKPKETSEIVFEWKSSVTIKRGLKAELQLQYSELYS